MSWYVVVTGFHECTYVVLHVQKHTCFCMWRGIEVQDGIVHMLAKSVCVFQRVSRHVAAHGVSAARASRELLVSTVVLLPLHQLLSDSTHLVCAPASGTFMVVGL